MQSVGTNGTEQEEIIGSHVLTSGNRRIAVERRNRTRGSVAGCSKILRIESELYGTFVCHPDSLVTFMRLGGFSTETTTWVSAVDLN